MRCYKLKAVTDHGVLATRLAGTNAEARQMRGQLADMLGIKAKSVTIDDENISLAKDDLLLYLNSLLKKQDKPNRPASATDTRG